jgi:hypothetical protein
MRHDKRMPMEIYVRHQSGPSSFLTFHLSDVQRLQLISALATGESVELAAQLELSVLPQWVTNPGSENTHAVIPLHQISFNVDPTRK